MKTKKIIQISIVFLIIVLNACSDSDKSSSAENDELSFKIITSDIDNFWQAYDSLKTTTDSVSTIQRLYIDKASLGLLEFFKVRPGFTAEIYVNAIKDYPKFWESVRKCTKKAGKNRDLIKKAFTEIKNIYPEFNVPDICFAISPVQTGGTTSEDNKTLLIGTEIVSADSNVCISEFDNILKGIIGTLDVLPFVIHESTHTAQTPKCEPSVLAEILVEGSADFITSYILKRTFNTKTYEYGYENECKIWNSIKIDMEENTNYERWFGSYDKNEHPDLGYFIGYRIVQSYFDRTDNKNKALIDIIQMKHPKDILKKSDYNGNCKN